MTRNKIYYLIGFLFILTINYLIKEYFFQNVSVNTNDINFYGITLETLRPIAIFLLVSFFSSRKPRAIVIAGVLAFLLILEFIVRYNGDKELIEYNELTGLLIGSTLLFAFEWFGNKQTNKDEKQIT